MSGANLPLNYVVEACENEVPTSVMLLRDHGRKVGANALGFVRGKHTPSSTRFNVPINATALHQLNERTVVVSFLAPILAATASLRNAAHYCIVQDSITNIVDENMKLSKTSLPVRSVLRFLNARYERRYYNTLNGVQVTTDEEKHFLASLGVRTEVHVNPNGSSASARPLTANRDFDVVMYANFRDPRNINMFSNGLHLLRRAAALRSNPTRLALLGWGSEQLDVSGGCPLRIEAFDSLSDPEAILDRSRILLCLDPHSTGIKNSVLQALGRGLYAFLDSRVAAPIQRSLGTTPAVAVAEEDSHLALVQLVELLNYEPSFQDRLDVAALISRHFSWDAYKDRLANWMFRR